MRQPIVHPSDAEGPAAAYETIIGLGASLEKQHAITQNTTGDSYMYPKQKKAKKQNIC